MEVCAPAQSNNFAALILKPDLSRTLHPWLQRGSAGLELNGGWLAGRYRTGNRPGPDPHS